MLRRYIHARERRAATIDTNRHVRPFEFGIEHLQNAPRPLLSAFADKTVAPVAQLTDFARRAVEQSELFFQPEAIADYRLDAHHVLTWTSAVESDEPENNLVRARFFPSNKSMHAKRAVVILPQWNAQPDSHIGLARLMNRFNLSALRLTLPYHEERRPAHLERAEYLVAPNIGRTLASIRQAVLDARAAVAWLAQQGFERIGIVGTSIGSCVAFLTFVHEPRLQVGVFNHVSGYFADVVWHGISTQHVRRSIEQTLTLEQTRAVWMPVSPIAFVDKLAGQTPRPLRFIAARYDLTFPPELSRDIINTVRATDIPLDVAWLPCGHYTLGELPWKYYDGYKIINFFRRKL